MHFGAMLLIFLLAVITPLFQVEGSFGSCKLCKGLTGLTKSQEVGHLILRQYYKAKTSQEKPHGKFHSVVSSIQKSLAQDFTSLDPFAKRKPLGKRLQDLKKYFKAAVDGGSHHFAREILGKGLHVHMKKRINDGVAIDNLHIDDTLYSNQDSYIDDFTNGVAKKDISRIFLLENKASLVIAIDTTASMSGEIASVKKMATDITNLNRNNAEDYFLAEFNDPRVPNAIWKGKNEVTDFLTAIKNLQATEEGNNECQEPAFQGMLNVFKNDPHPIHGSPMFVFTDADPKDGNSTNIDDLFSDYMHNYMKIYFFTDTRQNGWCGKKEKFFKVAENSQGHVFDLVGKTDISAFSAFTDNSLYQDATVASGGSLSLLYSIDQHHSFKVDSGIKKLHVALETESFIDKVYLESPTGQRIKSKSHASRAKMFEVDRPTIGSWRLTFPRGVGKYGFKVHSISSDPIDVSYHFLYQEYPTRNSPIYSLEHPLKGKENVLSLQLGHIKRVVTTTLKLDVITMHGQNIQTDLIVKQGATQDVYLVKLTPPDVPFLLRLKGKTSTGEDFERIARGVSQPSHLHIQALSAGDEFTAKIGHSKVRVYAIILNSGSRATFNISISAKHGRVSVSSYLKSITRSAYVSFFYTPPSDSKHHGRTEKIFISAKKQNDDDKHSTAFEVLLTKS